MKSKTASRPVCATGQDRSCVRWSCPALHLPVCEIKVVVCKVAHVHVGPDVVLVAKTNHGIDLRKSFGKVCCSDEDFQHLM